MQTHYSKKDGSVQYSYRCGGYASRVNFCTSHTISADNVEALILSAVKRFSKFVLNDEKAFALELQSLWKDKQEEKPKHNQSELKRCQKRYDELSTLIRGLYENLISGLLPERQYKQLMKQYDDEQAELEAKMETMKKELSEEKDSTMDIQHFVSLIRKYKNPTEVSDLMFTELIDKIVVYESEGVGKARTQKVDIYFNYVGQVDIAYTEEELAEIKEQEEQAEKKRLEKQCQREKAYREKQKAKKLAENGGEIVKTKVCPHCQKEFIPTSNRQIFCSKDCCYQARQDTNGSIDIAGAARSILAITRTPNKEAPTERYLVQVKSNLAPTGSAILFEVSEKGVDFISEMEMTAEEAFQSLAPKIGRPNDKEVKAKAFLIEMLKDGEMLSSDCEEKLEAAGFRKSTIKKAKKNAGVISRKKGFLWYWSLPMGDIPRE